MFDRDPATAATQAMILATALGWLAWELVALALVGRRGTISRAVWRWGEAWPWFPLALALAGALAYWHFFVG